MYCIPTTYWAISRFGNSKGDPMDIFLACEIYDLVRGIDIKPQLCRALR